MLGITYKSAWFMAMRIRESMRELHPTENGPLGGENKVVEVDETYIGGKARNQKGKVPPKEAVMALVEREGRVVSRHVPEVTAKTLRPILVSHIDRKSYLMTDESRVYPTMGREFAGHGTVNHSIEEYVRSGGFHHTNTVEGYFGIVGTFHHVSQYHLKRYLSEFDFRYNQRIALGVDDTERARRAIEGAAGKRITYRQPHGAVPNWPSANA
jgi:transposase-like protein